MFLGLVEMTSGLEYASFSLPEWQALKMTFFAPCIFCQWQSIVISFLLQWDELCMNQLNFLAQVHK